MAMEEFFVEEDTLSFPGWAAFVYPTIPQRFIDEARGDVIVRLTDDDYIAIA